MSSIWTSGLTGTSIVTRCDIMQRKEINWWKLIDLYAWYDCFSGEHSAGGNIDHCAHVAAWIAHRMQQYGK